MIACGDANGTATPISTVRTKRHAPATVKRMWESLCDSGGVYAPHRTVLLMIAQTF